MDLYEKRYKAGFKRKSGCNCIIAGCRDRSSKRGRLPHPGIDPVRYVRLLALINRLDLLEQHPLRVYLHRRICRTHYSEDCFLPNFYKLKPNALPDTGLPEPAVIHDLHALVTLVCKKFDEEWHGVSGSCTSKPYNRTSQTSQVEEISIPQAPSQFSPDDGLITDDSTQLRAPHEEETVATGDSRILDANIISALQGDLPSIIKNKSNVFVLPLEEKIDSKELTKENFWTLVQTNSVGEEERLLVKVVGSFSSSSVSSKGPFIGSFSSTLDSSKELQSSSTSASSKEPVLDNFSSISVTSKRPISSIKVSSRSPEKKNVRKKRLPGKSSKKCTCRQHRCGKTIVNSGLRAQFAGNSFKISSDLNFDVSDKENLFTVSTILTNVKDKSQLEQLCQLLIESVFRLKNMNLSGTMGSVTIYLAQDSDDLVASENQDINATSDKNKTTGNSNMSSETSLCSNSSFQNECVVPNTAVAVTSVVQHTDLNDHHLAVSSGDRNGSGGGNVGSCISHEEVVTSGHAVDSSEDYSDHVSSFGTLFDSVIREDIETDECPSVSNLVKNKISTIDINGENTTEITRPNLGNRKNISLNLSAVHDHNYVTLNSKVLFQKPDYFVHLVNVDNYKVNKKTRVFSRPPRGHKKLMISVNKLNNKISFLEEKFKKKEDRLKSLNETIQSLKKTLRMERERTRTRNKKDKLVCLHVKQLLAEEKFDDVRSVLDQFINVLPQVKSREKKKSQSIVLDDFGNIIETPSTENRDLTYLPCTVEGFEHRPPKTKKPKRSKPRQDKENHLKVVSVLDSDYYPKNYKPPRKGKVRKKDKIDLDISALLNVEHTANMDAERLPVEIDDDQFRMYKDLYETMMDDLHPETPTEL